MTLIKNEHGSLLQEQETQELGEPQEHREPQEPKNHCDENHARTTTPSALNYDLFTKNCSVSPACKYCNASIENAKHYFLYCPSFAALPNILLASTAHLHVLGRDRWLSASDKKRIDWLLNGVPDIEFQINVNLFQTVQSFISQSNHFW